MTRYILPLIAALLLPGCNLVDWGTEIEIEAPGEIAYVLAGQPVPPGSNLDPIIITYYSASDKTTSLVSEALEIATGSDSAIVGDVKKSEHQMLAQLHQAYLETVGALAKMAASAYGVPTGGAPAAVPADPARGRRTLGPKVKPEPIAEGVVTPAKEDKP